MSAPFAGGGVPMILVVMPALLIAFLPSVIIEARILGKRLYLEGRQAVRTSILANLVSTAVGVPVAWGLLAALEIVTGAIHSRPLDTFSQKLVAIALQAPWLPVVSRESWMVPAAALVLLLPFLAVSWRVETAVARIMLRDVPRERISRVVLLANAVTYAVLGIVAAAVLAARLA